MAAAPNNAAANKLFFICRPPDRFSFAASGCGDHVGKVLSPVLHFFPQHNVNIDCDDDDKARHHDFPLFLHTHNA